MLRLKFYQNSCGVWVGELLHNETRPLATTHPATIAAAIFAMDEYSVCVETDEGSFGMQFPSNEDESDPLAALMQDEDGKLDGAFLYVLRI